MAYTARWKLEKTNPKTEKLWEFFIGDREFSGSVTELPASDVPCKVDIKGLAFSDVFPSHFAIAPGAIELSFIDDGTGLLDEIYDAGDDTRFDILAREAGVDKLRMFVVPAELEHVLYSSAPSSIVGIDRLESLERVPYVDPSTGLVYEGKQTYIEVLTNCLQYTGLGLGLSTHMIWYPGSDLLITDDPLNNIVCDQIRFSDSNGNPFSCRFVLEQVLDLHLCHLYQWNTRWIVRQRLVNESSGEYTVFNYTSAGIVDSPATSNYTARRTVSIANGYTFDGPPSRRGVPAVGQVSAVYRHDNPFEGIFGNLSFESALGSSGDLGNWIATSGVAIVSDPSTTGEADVKAADLGVRFKVSPIDAASYLDKISQTSRADIGGGSDVQLVISWDMKLPNIPVTETKFAFRIKHGDGYLDWANTQWSAADVLNQVDITYFSTYHVQYGRFTIVLPASVLSGNDLNGKVLIEVYEAVELDNTVDAQANTSFRVDNFGIDVLFDGAVADEATYITRGIQDTNNRWTPAVRDFVIGDGPTTSHLSATYLKGEAGQPWFDSDWAWRIPITLKASAIDSDLTDFDGYIDLADLAGIVNGSGDNLFDLALSTGADLRLCDSDGETELPTELKSYSQGSEAGSLYYKKTRDSADDQIVFLYVGNASASRPADGDPNGQHAVWRSDVKLRMHHEDTPGNPATIEDSTSNGDDGQSHNMNGADLIAGIVRNAHVFDGSNDYIDVSLTAFPSGSFSFACLARLDSSPGGSHCTIAAINATHASLLGMFYLQRLATNKWKILILNDGATDSASVEAAGSSVDDVGDWIHLAFTYDISTKTVRLYRNAVLEGSDTHTGTIATASGVLYIGCGIYNNSRVDYFPGAIDETMLVEGVVSADWITANYNNYLDRLNFYDADTIEDEATGVAGSPTGALTANWSRLPAVGLSGISIFQFRNNQLIKQLRTAQRLITSRLAAIGPNGIDPTHYLSIERPGSVVADDYTWNRLTLFPANAGANAVAELTQLSDGANSNGACVVGIKPQTKLSSSLTNLVGVACDGIAASPYPPDSGTVYFLTSGGNSAGTVAPANAICDEAGLYRRNPDGSVDKIVGASALTPVSFDLYPAGSKVYVAYSNYNIMEYDLNGGNSRLLHTVSGASIGIGDICRMRDSILNGHKLYVRHGTGIFAWSLREINLLDDTWIVYGGSGSWSYPQYIAASGDKIYGISGNTISAVHYFTVGVTAGPSNLFTNGYAGNGQSPRGIIRDPAGRVYFGEYSPFEWVSINDTPPVTSGDEVDHGTNSGTNHVYDEENGYVWKGGNGLGRQASVGSVARENVPILYNGALLNATEHGALDVIKIVPFYN